MQASFIDAVGRSWQLQINVAAMRRARTRDINLSMPVEQLRSYLMDDVFLTDALWAIVEPDAIKAGLTCDQFENGMNGKVLAEATKCLWAALEDYYPDAKKSMLRAALAAVDQEISAAITSIASIGSKANSATESTTIDTATH